MDTAHNLPLVSTVAVGLSIAFFFGLLASKLRIPPIVGYLLAGIMIGPYTPGFVGDMNIASELSEIGVVLLMFGVGLHFSIKDLMEVRRIAITGAIVRIAIATTMGAGLAHLWGWSFESSLMFGLALSVASTVVLLRSLEEQNFLQSLDGRIAIGWLIVEDLVMILALVLIPTLSAAADEHASGPPMQQILFAFGKVALFILIMFVAGRRLLPWLLTIVVKTRSRELFTLAVFAVAIGIAFGAAELFGVSLALGAFFAGMMIKESDLNHEVADRALPFQDAFAVLFFVSVGMLFNPAILFDQPLNVLSVAGIVIAGKSLITFLVILLFGYTLKTALRVSAGLAQIGEFSFILVTMGLSLKLLPTDGRDLILAGAIISIALNPIIFYIARLIYEFTDRNPRLSRLFNMRDNDLAHLRSDEKQALRDLVILVGHGQVGKQISQNIQSARIDLVIIDLNRERVEKLRKNGFHAIAGDAGRAETLEDAAIRKAVALAVAVPDPFEARRIVETALSINPSIKVLVRAHNDEEMEFFTKKSVDLALTGPREIGRRMVEYLNGMRSNK